MKIFRVIAVGLMLAAPVQAQTWEDGDAAYSAGDYVTALENWRPLAEQGDASAQFILGFMYYNGRGVPQDYAAAVRWYRMAAEQGYAWAQYDLGLMYENGRGAPQDYVTAHMWVNIGSANGNPVAAYVRDEVLVPNMTPAQIAEAQRRARVCMESRYRDCY